jgi:hypothetical protein
MHLDDDIVQKINIFSFTNSYISSELGEVLTQVRLGPLYANKILVGDIKNPLELYGLFQTAM